MSYIRKIKNMSLLLVKSICCASGVWLPLSTADWAISNEKITHGWWLFARRDGHIYLLKLRCAVLFIPILVSRNSSTSGAKSSAFPSTLACYFKSATTAADSAPIYGLPSIATVTQDAPYTIGRRRKHTLQESILALEMILEYFSSLAFSTPIYSQPRTELFDCTSNAFKR